VAKWDRWPSTEQVVKDRDGWLSGIGGKVQDGWLRTGMGGYTWDRWPQAKYRMGG
jgi:hypothetical protein